VLASPVLFPQASRPQSSQACRPVWSNALRQLNQSSRVFSQTQITSQVLAGALLSYACATFAFGSLSLPCEPLFTVFRAAAESEAEKGEKVDIGEVENLLRLRLKNGQETAFRAAGCHKIWLK